MISNAKIKKNNNNKLRVVHHFAIPKDSKSIFFFFFILRQETAKKKKKKRVTLNLQQYRGTHCVGVSDIEKTTPKFVWIFGINGKEYPKNDK